MNFHIDIQSRIKQLPGLLSGMMQDPVGAWISSDRVVLQPANLSRPLLTSPPLHGATRQALWDSACRALSALCEQAFVHKHRMHLIVSDYWFNALVFSVGRGKLTDAEIESLLIGQYSQKYGDLGEPCKFAWDLHEGYLSSLAFSGADADLLEKELTQLQIRLTSMKPVSAVILNALPEGMPNCWVAIVQKDAFSMIRMDQQVVRDWRIFQTEGLSEENLATQLLRQSARKADSCRVLCVVDLTQSLSKSGLVSNLAQQGWTCHFKNMAELTSSQAYGWPRLMGVKHL